jgi:hypothetical protein
MANNQTKTNNSKFGNNNPNFQPFSKFGKGGFGSGKTPTLTKFNPSQFRIQHKGGS